MDIRTKIGDCFVFFGYESHSGEKFRSFNELLGDYYDNYEVRENSPVGFLTGCVYSPYYGCTERIDELALKGRPTIAEVKNFMKSCFAIMNS